MNIPHHVAIIMDGNGRWAEKKNLPRVRGHHVGGERVEEIIRCAPHYGVKYLTLYAFSKENWQRPKAEIHFLMDQLAQYLDKKLPQLMENNVRFNAIGTLTDLPEEVQQKIARNIEKTRGNTGLTVTFALSYSSRAEIADACRSLAEQVREGKMEPSEIDENAVAAHLYTRGLPDPDLLIRTSGEMRISNYLLWQISYAELYITDRLWPDFTEEEFSRAIQEFQKRERRFGRTSAAAGPAV